MPKPELKVAVCGRGVVIQQGEERKILVDSVADCDRGVLHRLSEVDRTGDRR